MRTDSDRLEWLISNIYKFNVAIPLWYDNQFGTDGTSVFNMVYWARELGEDPIALIDQWMDEDNEP